MTIDPRYTARADGSPGGPARIPPERPLPAAVGQFRNFLSWGVQPSRYNGHRRPDAAFAVPRPVPPAWFAYVMGITPWCPPKGEL